MKPGWKITKDRLFDPKWDTPSRVGTADGGEEDLTWPFRLYDDDGTLYYEGFCNEAAYEAGDEMGDGTLYKAWKWGEYDAGCTDLRLRLKDLEGYYPPDSDVLRIYRERIARPDGWCSIFA